MRHCSSCRYFRASKHESDMGLCFRYPPQLVSETLILNSGVERLVAQSLHPLVSADSWCGEFQPISTGPIKLKPSTYN